MAALLLTVNQVAEELSVNRATVYRLIADGALDTTDISTSRGSGRGGTRIPRTSIEAFIKARTTNARRLRVARSAVS